MRDLMKTIWVEFKKETVWGKFCVVAWLLGMMGMIVWMSIYITEWQNRVIKLEKNKTEQIKCKK